MLYLIAGMNRSGSTWLFNATRLLLRHAGAPDLAAGWIDDRDALLQHQTPLIKVHLYDPTLLRQPFVVLTSHRDLRDVAASMARKFAIEPTMDMVHFYFEQYRLWADHAQFDMRYETMRADPLAEVHRVAAALDVPLDLATAQRIVAEIDASTNAIQADSRGYDPVSLLHDQHITDGRPGSWREQIGIELADRIYETYAAWMQAEGYSPATPDGG